MLATTIIFIFLNGIIGGILFVKSFNFLPPLLGASSTSSSYALHFYHLDMQSFFYWCINLYLFRSIILKRRIYEKRYL